MKKVLILYSELAGYLITCLRQWALSGNQAIVVHWPVNPEAPFELPQIDGVDFISKDLLESEELKRLVNSRELDGIICSGWIDKSYLRAIAFSKLDIPSILVMDNQWKGTVKQLVFSRIARLVTKRFFSHAWVIGDPQVEFAVQMGFERDRIRTGFYSADVNAFKGYYEEVLMEAKEFPKTFLYVGRYVRHKGIFDLWEAFVQASEELDSDWKLICIGTGEEFENRVIHEDIIHLGFKQPDQLLEGMSGAGVFVLPSHFEPWGVVVHEFAAAGFPMLLSKEVGAGSSFLEAGKNGFYFESGNVEDLKMGLSKFMKMTDSQLREMSIHSNELALKTTPENWVKTLYELL
ncbi:MAG: glycosyltransferase [Flavobacteriales bacterium]|nr:glycosyltransferase [Flavobacteriales bacterium]